VIERVGSGDIQTVNLLSPAIRDGWVCYGQGQYGDSTDGYLRRYRIRTRGAQQAGVSSDRMLLASAAASDGLYAVISDSYDAACSPETQTDPSGAVVSGPCRLERLTSIVWRRYAPHRFRLEALRRRADRLAARADGSVDRGHVPHSCLSRCPWPSVRGRVPAPGNLRSASVVARG
jgi:hypothetical protein